MSESKETDDIFDGDLEAEKFQRLVKLAREIEALGYDHVTAASYASLIGDQPEKDEQGNVIVRAGGKEVARLKLKSFES